MSQIAQERKDVNSYDDDYEWQWIDEEWQWKPKKQEDKVLDQIPTRKEFNDAFEKSAVSVVGLLTQFNKLVVDTANGIKNGKYHTLILNHLKAAFGGPLLALWVC